MIIDNSKESTADVNTYDGHTDSSVSQSIFVTNVADEDTKAVARNIDTIKVVANKINEVVYIATTFEDTVKKVTDAKYNNKSATDILNEANTKFSADVLTQVANLNNLTNEIKTCSNLESAITSLDGMKAILTDLNANIANIQEVGGAIDNVNIVASLKAALDTTVLMQTELLAIYDRLNELQTIFNYLPEILQTYTYLVDLAKVRAKLKFTTEEYIDSLLKIGKNIESIITIALNVDDLVAVKTLLENAPNLLQTIKDELDTLLVTYQTQLTDTVTAGKRELEATVVDIKIEMGKILANLRASGGGGGTGGGVTTAEVLACIKQGVGVTINRDVINQTITINAESSTNIQAEDASVTITKSGDAVKIKANFTADNIKSANDIIKVSKNNNDVILTADLSAGLSEGNNITFNKVGNVIEISSTGGGNADTSINNFDVTKTWNPSVVTPDSKLVIAQEINGFNNTRTWVGI